MRPKELTLGALAMSLYVWTLALDQAGDPFRLIIIIIMVFRYLTPVFFWVMAGHYFTRMTLSVVRFGQAWPLVLRTLMIIEGPENKALYANAMGFQLYAVWAFYAILYPIIIWWVFHRVGLYK